MGIMWIGSASQYTKRLSLQNQWRMKKQSGDVTSHKKPLQDHVNFLRASDWLPDEDERDDRLSAIMTKAQAGRKLSPDEWEYLKAKYPEMYEKLRAIEKEAEGYEKALRRCKTKDEAQRLHVSKLGEILTQLKEGDSSAIIRLNRMSETMTAFTKSRDYHELPTEAEEAIERESERKEKVEALREEAAVKEAEREAREEAARSEEEEDGSASRTDPDAETGFADETGSADKIGSADKTGTRSADTGTGSTDGDAVRIPSGAKTVDVSHAAEVRRTVSPDGVHHPAVPGEAGRTGRPLGSGSVVGTGGSVRSDRGASLLSFGQKAYVERRDDSHHGRRRRRTIDAEA